MNTVIFQASSVPPVKMLITCEGEWVLIGPELGQVSFRFGP